MDEPHPRTSWLAGALHTPTQVDQAGTLNGTLGFISVDALLAACAPTPPPARPLTHPSPLEARPPPAEREAAGEAEVAASQPEPHAAAHAAAQTCGLRPMDTSVGSAAEDATVAAAPLCTPKQVCAPVLVDSVRHGGVAWGAGHAPLGHTARPRCPSAPRARVLEVHGRACRRRASRRR
jgi:hypothetical protein